MESISFEMTQCKLTKQQTNWYICIVNKDKPTAVVGLQGSRSAVYVNISHTAFHRHCISDIFPWKSRKSRALTNKSVIALLVKVSIWLKRKPFKKIK